MPPKARVFEDWSLVWHHFRWGNLQEWGLLGGLCVLEDMPLTGQSGPSLPCLSFMAQWPPGEQRCTTTCSPHNVLPHHRPRSHGASQSRLGCPHLTFPTLIFSGSCYLNGSLARKVWPWETTPLCPAFAGWRPPQSWEYRRLAAGPLS